MKENNLALISAEDLSLVDDNSLNANQLAQILKRTPKAYVKKRPAKGGGTWEYVTSGYVKKVLNLMFGWDWDFEILEDKVMHDEVIVKGRLTCRSNGRTIVKTQYGNKDIMYKRGTDAQGNRIPLSIGNDFKSASSDCLKKCASEIGIAQDIYNKEDFKEVKVKDWISDIVKAESLEELDMIWSAMSAKDQTNFQESIKEKQKSLK
tara:strand:+ start:539 stop:1156 length:618 start_codon:yes stop_codon:yes gene_type:complete